MYDAAVRRGRRAGTSSVHWFDLLGVMDRWNTEFNYYALKAAKVEGPFEWTDDSRGDLRGWWIEELRGLAPYDTSKSQFDEARRSYCGSRAAFSSTLAWRIFAR